MSSAITPSLLLGAASSDQVEVRPRHAWRRGSPPLRPAAICQLFAQRLRALRRAAGRKTRRPPLRRLLQPASHPRPPSSLCSAPAASSGRPPSNLFGGAGQCFVADHGNAAELVLDSRPSCSDVGTFGTLVLRLRRGLLGQRGQLRSVSIDRLCRTVTSSRARTAARCRAGAVRRSRASARPGCATCASAGSARTAVSVSAISC